MIYNIISNTCIGARYYNLINQPFQNQFMWTLIKLKDFIDIIKNFDDTNFLDYDIFYTSGEIHKEHSNEKCVTIQLKNTKSKIYFIHHHYTSKHLCQKFQRINSKDFEIIGSNIIEYVSNNWNKRTQRNINNKIKPIFVYCDFDSLRNGNINELLNIENKNIIIMSHFDYSKFETKNIHFIQIHSTNTIQLAKQLNDYLKI